MDLSTQTSRNTARLMRTARPIVACVLMHRGQLALLRRSAMVTGDRGRWHCVTGYLPDGEDPMRQAITEVREETGTKLSDLRLVRRSPAFEISGAGLDTLWQVHPFLFEVPSDNIFLNWEHDSYRWVNPREILTAQVVPWFEDVCVALGVEVRASSTLRR